MKPRVLAALVCLALALTGLGVALLTQAPPPPPPRVSSRLFEMASAKVSVEVTEQPLAEVAQLLGEALGFSRVQVLDPSAAAETVSLQLEDESAWEGLLRLAEPRGLLLRCEDQLNSARATTLVLGLPLPWKQRAFPKRRYAQRCAGGLLLTFAQDEPGATRPGGREVWSPYGFGVVGRPGLVWRYRSMALHQQRSAGGAAVEVLRAVAPEGLRPRLTPLAPYPWQGLSSFSLGFELAWVEASSIVDLSALAYGTYALPIVHAGAPLFELVSVLREDAYALDRVALRLPYPKPLRSTGRGGEVAELGTGARFSCHGPQGELLPWVAFSCEGGGDNPLRVTLSLRSAVVDKAGGIGALRLQVTLPKTWKEERLEVPFADLFSGK